MLAALKFTGFLLLTIVAIPICLALVAGLIALALAWVLWPLVLCLAAIKYLFT
jgi:hypothetical protein